MDIDFSDMCTCPNVNGFIREIIRENIFSCSSNITVGIAFSWCVVTFYAVIYFYILATKNRIILWNIHVGDNFAAFESIFNAVSVIVGVFFCKNVVLVEIGLVIDFVVIFIYWIWDSAGNQNLSIRIGWNRCFVCCGCGVIINFAFVFDAVIVRISKKGVCKKSFLFFEVRNSVIIGIHVNARVTFLNIAVYNIGNRIC